MTQQYGLGGALGIAQGLTGLRGQISQQQAQQEQIAASQQQRAMLQQQQEAQQAQAQQWQNAVQRFQQGDQSAMGEMILMDPELAGQIREQIGAVDQSRAEQLQNTAFGFKQAVRAGPEVATQYFQQRMANDPAFAEFSDEVASGQFDRALAEMGAGVAAIGGAEAFDAFQGPQPELKATGEGYQLWNPQSNTFSTPAGDVPLTPEQAANQTAIEAERIKAQVDALSGQTERADALRGEITKKAKELGIDKTFAALNRIEASNDGTAAGDLALIFNYMKMLDPASVVRESEFATAQNAAGVPERVRNTYNRLMEGERLSQAQRENFSDQARSIYERAKGSFEQAVQPYLDLGEQSNLSQRQILGEGYFESFAVDQGDGQVVSWNDLAE